MIKATLKQLEEKATERGYTLEQVRGCISKTLPDGALMIDETHKKYPHKKKFLGDRIADGLASVGITPERVSKILGGDCGCNSRKAKLNELHKKALNIMRPKNAKQVGNQKT